MADPQLPAKKSLGLKRGSNGRSKHTINLVITLMVQRVSTGIPSLDVLIEGGFPADSLILLVGCPGAGKSTLAAQFLYTGATTYGERGAYISFAETKRIFLRNMLRFGWDFERLEKDERVSVLDLPTAKEAELQQNVNEILEVITKLKVNRLVLDSFTAISMSQREPIDTRVLFHTFYQFLKEIHCVSLLIVDKPWGAKSLGRGGIEFIADGIIFLETFYGQNNVLRRRLKISKMRGTSHAKKAYGYDIDEDGFRVLWTEAEAPVEAKKAQDKDVLRGVATT